VDRAAFGHGTESLERSDKDAVEWLKAGARSSRLHSKVCGISSIGNALTRIVSPEANGAFSFMTVWQEPAGSDRMMQLAV